MKTKEELIKDLKEESTIMNYEAKTWLSEVKLAMRAIELNKAGIKADDL